MELHKKWRPKKLKRVIGQPEAVKELLGYIKRGKKFPHAIMFAGERGCGKTSLGRIVSTLVGCDADDYHEINCATARGIDMVRELSSETAVSPMGDASVWTLDEAQSLTKDAQNGLLKIIEEPPSWVYFILCTTHPTGIIPTIRSRCTVIPIRPIAIKDITRRLNYVARKEKIDCTEEVIDRIANCAMGSLRDALVLLEKIVGIEGEEEQLEIVSKSDPQHEAIALAKVLLDYRSSWAEAQKVIKNTTANPEDMRRAVCNYVGAVLLNTQGKMAARCYRIVDAFRDNVFDSGKAGISAAAYEVYNL